MAPSTDQAIAQAACITASLFLVGQNAYIAFGAIPAILNHQTSSIVVARQWKTVYSSGFATGPLCGFLGSLTAGYLAAQHDPSSRLFRAYAASALLQIAIMPWTLVAILPTNNKLFKIVDSGKEEKKEEVFQLIRKWTKVHTVRVALTAAGGLLALWTAVSN